MLPRHAAGHVSAPTSPFIGSLKLSHAQPISGTCGEGAEKQSLKHAKIQL